MKVQDQGALDKDDNERVKKKDTKKKTKSVNKKPTKVKKVSKK